MQPAQLSQEIPIINYLVFSPSIVNLFLSKVALFHRRHQTRRQLAKLSSAQLNDIGISREQALEESQKPFWK